MRTYTVVGTGALGCLYGARLAIAGHRVRYLARPSGPNPSEIHIALPTSSSLDVRDIEIYEDPGAVPASDVIIIALKASSAPNPGVAALDALAGGDTAVVTLQNGLGIEADLEGSAGARPLLGGLCFTAANRVGPGRVELLGGGAVTLAQHGASTVTPAVAAVAADLDRAGVPVTVEPDLVAARWKKLAWNIPFNSLAALHGLTPNELLAHEAGSRLTATIMSEVAAAAAACGMAFPDDLLGALIARTRELPPYRTSMGLDAVFGRPLETEVIIGRPLRAGLAAGAAMPVTASLLDQLLVRFG